MGRPKIEEKDGQLKHGIEYDQNCLKQNALKREPKNLILVLINVGDQHSNNGEKIHSSLKSIYLARNLQVWIL